MKQKLRGCVSEIGRGEEPCTPYADEIRIVLQIILGVGSIFMLIVHPVISIILMILTIFMIFRPSGNKPQVVHESKKIL